MVRKNLLRTNLCSLLGIEYPIMQAGMGLVARAELAAAVSNAGGLGVIGGARMEPEELREEVRKVRTLTDRPFGVDLLLASVPTSADEVVERYTDKVRGLLAVVLEEKVPVFISGLGNPAGAVSDMHAAGIIVMSLVGNVKNARRVEASGVDVVIAQGHEAGGHTGRIGTLALVPQIVDAVRVPVAAAGGIADGRGVVAALALGACGVWMGTRFCATHEAFSHINYKNKIVEIGEEDTVVTRAYTGKPCRVIKNKFTDEWATRESEILPYPLQGEKIGEAVAQASRVDGNTNLGSSPAGQNSGLIREIKGAGKVVQDIVEEAVQVLEQALPSAVSAGRG